MITKNTTLAEIMKSKNGSKVLAKNGVPCLSCPMAQFEVDDLQIGEVCKTYGLNLKKILTELNPTSLQNTKRLVKSKKIKK